MENETMRLQKYLALCGVASRRHCEEIIAQGRVQVNGVVVREMGMKVSDADEILVDDVRVRPEEEKRYILYHKPAGEVTTASDDKGRATVLDRFADLPVRLFPIGRLDYDSEGLLLLSNDGELMQRMLHPSREVDKVYLARITGDLPLEAIRQLRSGVLMDGEKRKTARADVRVIKREAFACVALVTIHEGRNRQVRRMFDAVGHRVLMLRRVQFGPLQLGNLERGQWRDLTAAEVEKLKSL